MHIDQEPAVDRAQLQSLIKKQTQAETKSLMRKELNKLKEKIKNLESKKSEGPYRDTWCLAKTSKDASKTDPNGTKRKRQS
jgi:hypothetical protein